MIRQDYGTFLPMCDHCSKELMECETIGEALYEMEAAGWTNDPDYCPDCQGEWYEED